MKRFSKKVLCLVTAVCLMLPCFSAMASEEETQSPVIASGIYDFSTALVAKDVDGVEHPDKISWDDYQKNSILPTMYGTGYNKAGMGVLSYAYQDANDGVSSTYGPKAYGYSYGIFGKTKTDRVVSVKLDSSKKHKVNAISNSLIRAFFPYGATGGTAGNFTGNPISFAKDTTGKSMKFSFGAAFDNLSLAGGFRLLATYSVNGKINSRDNIIKIVSDKNIAVFNNAINYTLNENQWYKFDFVMTSNGVGAGSLNYKFYINNEEVSNGTVTPTGGTLNAETDCVQMTTFDVLEYYDGASSKDIAWESVVEDGVTYYKAKGDATTYLDDFSICYGTDEAAVVPGDVTAVYANSEYSSLNEIGSALSIIAPMGVTASNFYNNVTLKEGDAEISYILTKDGEILSEGDSIDGAYIAMTTKEGGTLIGKVSESDAAYIYANYTENSEYAYLNATTAGNKVSEIYAPFEATYAEFKENVTLTTDGENSLEYYLLGDMGILEDADLIEGAEIYIIDGETERYAGRIHKSVDLYCNYFESGVNPAEFTMLGTGISVNYPSNIGGTGENNKSMEITAIPYEHEDGTYPDSVLPQLDLDKIAVGIGTKPITIEQSLYFEETASLERYDIYYRIKSNGNDGTAQLKFLEDGTFGNNVRGYVLSDYAPAKINQWVRVATTFYPGTKYAKIYANGKNIFAGMLTEKVDDVARIRYRVLTSKEEPYGKMYLDNLKIYSGTYQSIAENNTEVTVKEENISEVTIYDNKEIIYVKEGTTETVADLLSKLDYSEYASWSYEGENITDGMALVLTSEDSVTKRYFTVKISGDDIILIKSATNSDAVNDTVNVSASVLTLFGKAYDLKYIATEYTEGALSRIATKDVSVNGLQSVYANLAFDKDVKDIKNNSVINVYLWDADSLEPITEKTISEIQVKEAE